ncbi:hypothetical protein DFH27DRAFT_570465 [Peziza echinospora]|nr:hypothetical protein DFH27DRAFT_570465 [Peziza echinospora]
MASMNFSRLIPSIKFGGHSRSSQVLFVPEPSSQNFQYHPSIEQITMFEVLRDHCVGHLQLQRNAFEKFSGSLGQTRNYYPIMPDQVNWQAAVNIPMTQLNKDLRQSMDQKVKEVKIYIRSLPEEHRQYAADIWKTNLSLVHSSFVNTHVLNNAAIMVAAIENRSQVRWDVLQKANIHLAAEYAKMMVQINNLSPPRPPILQHTNTPAAGVPMEPEPPFENSHNSHNSHSRSHGSTRSHRRSRSHRSSVDSRSRSRARSYSRSPSPAVRTHSGSHPGSHASSHSRRKQVSHSQYVH